VDKEDIKKILDNTKVIAMVGLSPNPKRDSGVVAKYLISQGYRVIPVNPVYPEISGLNSYASLLNIPYNLKVDVVDVFRKSEETPALALDAVAIGASCLWLQLGIKNEKARDIAQKGGLIFIQDHCLKIEHTRYFKTYKK
jgi:predicted CoA-binding protein